MPDTSDILIFWAVVMLRFFIPLAIPRYPLPAVIASMVLDTVDQTIFQQFTSLPLEGYQGYDKALDIYYLAITYLSTLRNWSNLFAFKVSRFLFYYRIVGVTLFELTHLRPLLLIFPNTFEYFFDFYEGVRLKWNPSVLTKKKLITATALIWVFIKLPQEYWIHIAKLDTTDWIRANPANALILIAWALFLLGMAWALLRDLPPMKPGFSIAADPLPAAPEGFSRQGSGTNFPLLNSAERFFNNALVEKIVLVSLLSIIFAQVLPEVRSTSLQLAIGIAIIIIINTALSHWLAKRGNHWRSIIREFIVMTMVNFGIVLAFDFLLPKYGGSTNLFNMLFFVLLLTLNVTLYDRYHVVHIRYNVDGGNSGREGKKE
ncbi:hypothetical protein MSBRW_2059 [Methanosarcina barkeri str. Wiesmoor]|uniref:Uncharacterized protein n=2 Tax=Methanosarcina barkeri TaxID=2208 RepID=A0A0E3QMR4_METBA|nr:hypothetical protein [Methanosarcina barkeri]AKB51312.1 hypothetical protein MSBRW_2059 [Methanosarcina barkeri str. Wiesmoor]